MRGRFVVAAVVLVAVVPGRATAQEYDLERFQLFNECSPMNLIVEDLPDGAAAIDLTVDRIQTLAESRLRAARLYNPDADAAYLYVRVGVLMAARQRGGSFNTLIAFKRILHDPRSDQLGMGQTWETGGFGTHGSGADYILQRVSEYLDRFILEYLRVNEDACQQ